MVRFSDIIKIKDKADNRKRLPGNGAKGDKLWLSDSQILKVKGKRISPETSLKGTTSLEVIAYYEKFLEKVIEIRDRVKDNLDISPSPILSDLHYIIDNNLIDELYEYAMSTPDDYEDMLAHTVEVTFASLKVGEGMGYDTKRLLELGLAAFLENVGMYKIPDNILKKEGKLKEEEILLITKHPEASSQILSRMGERYKWLAEVALQVHERSDGSGYPGGLKEGEISELASIIGLLDIYVAMIKKRPYRDKLVQTDAVKFIIRDSKELFPSRVLKTFLNQISLFPVNTHVRLNNKSIGLVVSTDKNQPLRPTVEILYDGQGNKMEKREVVRLADNPLLHIIESIDEKELP